MTHIHTKFLLRRLAYVPWLLTIGLVLGWNGEAMADAAEGTETNHSKVTNHTHVTDPYLRVSVKLDPTTDGTADSVFVYWSKSDAKNFHTSTGNGVAAQKYQVTLFPGEVPSNVSDAGVSSLTATDTGTERTGTTDNPIPVGALGDTLTADFDAMTLGPGFYWLRMRVEVPDADAGSGVQLGIFTKQIVVKPDYILSLNPSNVREDVNKTVNIEAKVKVSDDTKVTNDTTVPLALGIGQTGLNSRFGIVLPTVTIRKGQKEATGTIQFTPINDSANPTPDDDLIVNIKTTGIGGADIRLIDADKTSTRIDLSFSKSTLNKNDGSTDITVTATLNGKVVNQAVTVPLIIDEEASTVTRDVDYTATIRSINIPRRRVSGTATINIRPNATAKAGSIHLKASSNPTVGGNTIVVNPGSIEISEGPTSSIKGLTATPYSIREDAGTKEVTLEVSLQNALLKDEVVQFTISDSNVGLDARFDDASLATRDVNYRAVVRSLTILKGETTGTTTMTVTPINNDEQDGLRVFRVSASVGGGNFHAGILLTDDDTTSKSITLEVSPTEITEDDGVTTVTVTGTLNGKVFKDNVIVSLVIDDDINGDGTVNADDGAAQRDLDYTASLSPLVIPAGATAGATTITITPVANDGKEGDEKIGLNSSGKPKARDDDDVEEELDVIKAAITLKDTQEAGATPSTPDPTKPVFADTIAVQEYTAGTAIADLVLPEATGGTAPLTYVVSTLPAGLSFDSATRTISGTPTEATTAAVVVFYTVVDSDGNSAALLFSITVNEAVVPPPSADAELSVTPSSIREDAGTTQVALTVTLAEAKATDETVTFTIVAPSQGQNAVRDVDYTASMAGSPVTIAAGATVGTATLTLAPVNNTQEDSLRALGVQAAFSSGATLVQDIKIVDDETASTAITLAASPQTVSEAAGETIVTVTATLDGKALSNNTTVVVTINSTSSAARDVDYSVTNFSPWIEIPAGSTVGVMRFTLHPTPDNTVEGSETIKLTGKIDGLMADEVEITLTDPVTDPPADDSSLAFIAGVEDQTYAAGTAITPLELPAARGGTGVLTYVVSSLPAGLSFNFLTRTIAGTPTAATDGPSIVVYTVVDEGGNARLLTFFITVEAPSAIAFAADAVIDNQEYTTDTAIAPLVLPQAIGGTAPLTYTVSSLPAGLVFDPATRTISGTPSAATEGAVPVVYQATDAGGEVAVLSFSITVNKQVSIQDIFSNLFGSGKIVPTDASDWATIREFVVGEYVDGLVLPEGTGGTAPLTYSLSPALPAGLTFDPATRTISGTPQAASEAVYTYTVTDANGASASLALQVLPAAFSLADNFPNPFNPATTIQYALPQAADVDLTVYNVVGQVVRTLVAEHQSAGRYTVEWDATNDSGHSLSAGMYFYRLQAGGEFAEVKKMLLLK